MAIQKVTATEYTCDGCGKRETFVEEPVGWYVVAWTLFAAQGAYGDTAHACRESCITKAIRVQIQRD